MRRTLVLLALLALASCDSTEPVLPLHGTYTLHTWNGKALPQESPVADYPRTLHAATVTLSPDGTYREEWHYRNRYAGIDQAWTVTHNGRFVVTRDGLQEMALEFRHASYGIRYPARLDREGLECDHGEAGLFRYRLQ